MRRSREIGSLAWQARLDYHEFRLTAPGDAG
jgi:hypothetical protein